MSDKVLAMDIATQTGIAFDSDVEGVPVLETFRLPPSSDGNVGPGFVTFRKTLVKLLERVNPAIVCIEAPLHIAGGHRSTRPTNQQTVYKLLGLAAIAEETCCGMGYPIVETNIMTAKKHLTGNGHADKAMMMRMCRTLRWDAKTSDEADAAALWCHLKALRDPRFAPRSTPLFASRPDSQSQPAGAAGT